MRSAADIDEVGWPEPAPVLARMLSALSCWASARHSFEPAVRWSICWVTTYLPESSPLRTSPSYLPRPRITETVSGPAFRRRVKRAFARIRQASRRPFAALNRSLRRGKHGSCGTQGVAGTLRRGEPRRGAREPAASPPRGGERQAQGGHDR